MRSEAASGCSRGISACVGTCSDVSAERMMLRRTVCILLMTLASGCGRGWPAGWLMAQSPSASGSCKGLLSPLTLHKSGVGDVRAMQLRLDHSVALTSRTMRGSLPPERVSRAILVDRQMRIVPVDETLLNQRVHVSGEISHTVFGDRDDSELLADPDDANLAVLTISGHIKPEKTR